MYLRLAPSGGSSFRLIVPDQSVGVSKRDSNDFTTPEGADEKIYAPGTVLGLHAFHVFLHPYKDELNVGAKVVLAGLKGKALSTGGGVLFVDLTFTIAGLVKVKKRAQKTVTVSAVG